MQHDLAKCGTTNLHQHINKCKAKSKSASQPSSSRSLLRKIHGSYILPKYKIPFQQKEKVCAAPHDSALRGITADYYS